ncbi:hypothetical protein [Cytobacillus praedii]|uniref:hypothetical protein n=1 Tax=Cytobacillus praedii TaxID=1742358 RepID=UPI002E1AD533|nr:hypothetical protein [Cytobacillus praedii]
MVKPDRSVDLLKRMRGPGQNKQSIGLYVVKVVTAGPDMLQFEGSKLPLDSDLFEIPIRLIPLEEGARYFALPIIGGDNNRWGLLEKIDGTEATGSFTTVDSKTVTVTNGIVKKIE